MNCRAVGMSITKPTELICTIDRLPHPAGIDQVGQAPCRRPIPRKYQDGRIVATDRQDMAT